MLLPALLAVVALADTAPTMRVTIGDLDFERPRDVNVFVQRTRIASRAYCARHIAIVTPDRLRTPEVCERAMAGLAFEALPRDTRQTLIRSGQSRRFR